MKAAISVNTLKDRVLSSYFMIPFVILALVLIAATSNKYITNNINRKLLSNAQATLDALETELKTDLKESRTALGSQSEYVRNMILNGAGEEEVHTYLNDINEYILQNEGKPLLGFGGIYGYFNIFGGEMLDGQDRYLPENYEPAEQPWYKEAVAAGGEIVYLPPHTGELTPVAVITYARSLFDNNGKLLGAIAMDTEFKRIREYIVNENLEKLWLGILLNEQYEYISQRNPEMEGIKFEDVNSDAAGLVAELKLGRDVSEFRMKDNQNVISTAFIRKMDNGWYLGIVTPEKVYFEELRRVRALIILLVIVLSVVFTILILRVLLEKNKVSATTISKIENISFHSLNTCFLLLLSFITLYPFWTTIAVSFNDALDSIRGGITFFPRKFSLFNYEVIFRTGAIPHAFFISVARTSINLVTSVFFTAMIAFALSRREFILSKPFTFILVLSMYVNAGLIPTFLLIRNLGMYGTFWVYIIPGIVNAFNFVVMRTYMRTIPESIIESARIDGYGDFYIFIRIIFPLCLPVLATIGLFVAVGSWNAWFDTMIYNSGDERLHTLQYKLMEYLQSSQSHGKSASDAGAMALSAGAGGGSGMVTPMSIRAAITVIAAAPILLIYPFMQRYFVVGLNVGGVKE
jgi:putative aldouronate transport system permease protein